MRPVGLADRTTPLAQAAFWFNQHRAGDMTAVDRRAFQIWLHGDPAHQQAYAALERQWALIGDLAENTDLRAAMRKLDAELGDRRRRRIFLVAAALSLALIAGWTVVRGDHLSRRHDNASPRGQRHATAVGERREVALPDGSRVTLDTASSITVHDMRRRRLVILDKGRAYFQVDGAVDHPFTVIADGREVRATGTSFIVRIDPDAVRVALAEGRLAVEHAGSKVDMAAGEKLTVPAAHAWTREAVDIARETSWLNGQLSFINEPLASAITEVNRYSRRQLVFPDGKIPDRRIVGIFPAGDCRQFAEAMEMNGFARIVATSNDRIELSPVVD